LCTYHRRRGRGLLLYFYHSVYRSFELKDYLLFYPDGNFLPV